MEEQELTDFDEDLAEELRVYDEFRDGDTVQGTINRVEMTDNDGIGVYVDMPWNEEIYRYFKKPQDDPSDEFERFVTGIGYDLNAASNIPDEKVPCKYDEGEEEWGITIQESKTRRTKETANTLAEKAKKPATYFSLTHAVAIASGLALASPIITTFFCLGVIKWEFEKLNDPDRTGDPEAAFAIMTVGWFLVNTLWYLGWYIFYFNEQFLPFIPSL